MLYIITILIIIYIHILIYTLPSRRVKRLEYIIDSNVCCVQIGGKTVATYRYQSRNHKIFNKLHKSLDTVSFSELAQEVGVDEDRVYSSLKNLRLRGDLLIISRKEKWAKIRNEYLSK